MFSFSHNVFRNSFSQTTNFRLFQIKRADIDFKFDENGRKFSKQVENTVGKGEIAHYECFELTTVSLILNNIIIYINMTQYASM